MEGAGRSNGEPHEIFNAEFGPLGKTTMYMTRLNREVNSFLRIAKLCCMPSCTIAVSRHEA